MFVACFLQSVFLYYFVYCFSFVYICLYNIFVHVYRPLPPGANPIAVNKYHIISFNIVAQFLFPII